MNFTHLRSINLKALRIGENLGDMISCFKRENLKELSLEMNGIEPVFCVYLKHMINFDTIEHLNISYNWIGMEGLEHLREHFKMFKKLKVLNLTSNKLFLLPNHRTENLRDMLLDVKDTLEELHLGENIFKKSDFDILAPGLACLNHLKRLNFTKNRINGQSLRRYLDLCISSTTPSLLESLYFRQNDLRDDGVSDLLDRVASLPNLKYVNVVSNKLTFFIMPKLLWFIKTLDQQRPFTLEMSPREIHPKEKDIFITNVKKAVIEREICGASKFRLVFV